MITDFIRFSQAIALKDWTPENINKDFENAFLNGDKIALEKIRRLVSEAVVDTHSRVFQIDTNFGYTEVDAKTKLSLFFPYKRLQGKFSNTISAQTSGTLDDKKNKLELSYKDISKKDDSKSKTKKTKDQSVNEKDKNSLLSKFLSSSQKERLVHSLQDSPRARIVLVEKKTMKEKISSDEGNKKFLRIVGIEGEKKEAMRGCLDRICPYCGAKHPFKGLRELPPFNITSNELYNFNSLAQESSYGDICPACSMALLFGNCYVSDGKGIRIELSPGNPLFAFLCSEDEALIKLQYPKWLGTVKDLEDKEKYITLPHLPYLIERTLGVTSRATGNFEWWGVRLYLAWKVREGKAESVVGTFSIDRFDILKRFGQSADFAAKAGAMNSFLASFIKQKKSRDEKSWRPVFDFYAVAYTNFSIDFSTLKEAVCLLSKTKDLNDKPNISSFRGAYKYVKDFLEVTEMTNKENSIILDVLKSGRRFGILWKNLADEAKASGENENAYRSTVLRLDKGSPSVFHNTLRRMYGELSLRNKPANLSDHVLDAISHETKRYLREVFITGVYFGFFSSYTQQNTSEVDEE